jgi:hypothetical protein
MTSGSNTEEPVSFEYAARGLAEYSAIDSVLNHSSLQETRRFLLLALSGGRNRNEELKILFPSSRSFFRERPKQPMLGSRYHRERKNPDKFPE